MGSEIVTGFWSQLGSLGASHTVPFLQFVFCFNWEKSRLENTLLWIRPLCSDFEKKRERSDGEEKWLTTLRDICNEGRQLVYEIDEVQRQVDVSGNMAAKVLCFLSHLPFYSAMACKMKRIRERLNAAAEDYTKFPPLQQVEGSTDKRKETRETTSLLGHTEVIGREMDKKAIKTLIRESRYEKNVLIIPIIGIGGLGKTTLARLVYNDEEEDKNHFDLKMWVWVSTDFNMETLVKKVIAEAERAATTAYSGLGMNQLQSSLRAKLDGKKYMLVLDDVWETNQLRWTPFRDLLMGGAKGSVILVTTRDKAVGRITSNTPDPGNPEPYIYILKSLSEDDSWSLFKEEECQRELEEKPQLRTVGEKILVECGGNPLAIKTVGSLLFGKGTLLKWLDVKNKLWELDAGDTGILPSLKVSYDHLSFYLQKCFAHCGLFPKGYMIKKTTLIQLWMAEEEYIQPEKKILEAGEDYFETLLDQNFFEDEKKDTNGNITHCKMYDLMYYLAETVVDNYSIIRIDDADGARISKSVIHASISELPCQFPTSILTAKKLRTFISTVRPYRPIDIGTFTNVKRCTDISKEDFDSFALTFKSLRALGLVGFCWWDNFAGRCQNWELQNIKKLKHLRYLDLSFTQISTLPNSVCMLRHLQTLKLNGCEALTELPRDIKKLKSLTHLENDDCPNLKGIPCGIGQLTCIRTLKLFVLGEGAGLSELETLNNLRGDLEIQIRENAATSVESRKACLKEKQYLQTLKLDLQESNGVELSLEALQPNPHLKVLWINRYGGVRFPSWILKMRNSLPYLVQIKLFHCPRCVRFPLFADLPCLEELWLRNLQSLEYIDSYISDSSSSFSSSFKGWFPSLKKVYLQSLPKLKEWTRVVNDGGYAKTEAVAEEPTQQLLSLDSLEKLTISHCPELTSMPLHPNVEELNLGDVSGVLIKSMTMAATVSPTAASSSLLPSSFTFSKLKSLQISGCKDPMSLGEGWLGNLTSLERLKISKCPELNFSDEDNDMTALRSLHSLKRSHLSKLAALPKVRQHSTALETLEIEECPGLMTLPDWFGKLTSLRQLQISDCSELKSLPEGMRCLTALQELTIWSCPHLSETCRKEMGKDWPKIAHIQMVEIDWKRL